ncbi:DUF3106 domain-containing protein [Roseateles oligotrophus]|uniref:DUF3106 domain-containing protein n=1 Tax=Roseateles oligotrophus TaxID=1769250 RepID=A0ABT2YAX3_9BURK|nr:DUF3106 domain-containing protein [Roseateles oligotrophus]MCV2367453.1 DUF3106 domain-containing protein [Roseateles oligotrophus]
MSQKSNDFMPMTRLDDCRSSKRRNSQRLDLLLAALTLLASQVTSAQTPLPADGAASSAPLVASPPASAPVAAEPLQRLAPSKIAAPNAMLPAPTWVRLNSAQKAILLPLEQDWDSLDAARKSQWLEVATRFSALSAEEQARAQERMREWARLSPAERQQARISFQGAKKITAEERQAKWEAYQALPQEQRQQLADKAAKKLATQASKAALDSSADKARIAPLAKSNLVPTAVSNQALKAVAPSLLQAKPGATTVLMTQDKLVPTHQKAGHTKVLANPDLVDSKTLLPKRPQHSASAP